jgi:hypothetical protein
MAHPPTIRNKRSAFDPEIWKPGVGDDPARYLVYPGTINAPGRHTPGNLRHARPYLVNGSKFFPFPTPIEGFRRSGQAQLGLRHFIGDNTVDGVTMHYEEGRITLSGTFPGTTSRQNMVECINILRSHTRERGLVLYAPGVFEREQYVLPENWDFSHEEDDRTHSISYTITFVRIGEGKGVKDPTGTPPPRNPKVKTNPKGKPQKYYTTREGVRTLRAIAWVVYKDANKWKHIVDLNRVELASWTSSTTKPSKQPQGGFALPFFRFDIGTKFRV